MELRDYSQTAIETIDRKTLRDVKVGDRIEAKANSRKKVAFIVTGIKRSNRGWAVSLRNEEGDEWIIPGVRWTPPSYS